MNQGLAELEGMEPLISLTLQDKTKRHVFRPGDRLECEYQIDCVEPEDVQAVEASVLWYTEGKGDEDLGVHYFERRVTKDAPDGNVCQFRRFDTRLPPSPLSYSGRIVKIRWCVRVRVFMARGKDIFYDHPFQLGELPGLAGEGDGSHGVDSPKTA